jgi:hypothetical protein
MAEDITGAPTGICGYRGHNQNTIRASLTFGESIKMQRKSSRRGHCTAHPKFSINYKCRSLTSSLNLEPLTSIIDYMM